MVTSLILLAIAITNGFLLTFCIDKESFSLRTRAGLGILIGMVILAWESFLLALFWGKFSYLTTLPIMGSQIFLLFFLGNIYKRERAALLTHIHFPVKTLWYYGFWMGLLFIIFSRLILINNQGIHITHSNNYGDLPFHLSIIFRFAIGDNFQLQNPMFANTPFAYSFLIDSLSSYFYSLSHDINLSLFIVNFPLAVSTVFLLITLGEALTRNSSAGKLTPFLFFFSGGFAFINYFRDIFKDISSSPFNWFTHVIDNIQIKQKLSLPIFGEIPLHWQDIIGSNLIPQRSMLFGIPLMCAFIFSLHECFKTPSARDNGLDIRKWFCFAGCLMGLSPFLHAYFFISSGIAVLGLMLCFPRKNWLFFIIPAVVLALPQVLWIQQSGAKTALLKISLGWMSENSSTIIFWLVNHGLFICIYICAIFLLRNRLTPKFHWIFSLWFILPNLFLFAPWVYDNQKIFVFWMIAASPLVAYVYILLLNNRNTWKKLIAVLLLTLQCASHSCLAIKAASGRPHRMWSDGDALFSDLIQKTTSKHSIILHAPIHNSLVVLSGRQSFISYPGHLWTHGIQYGTRLAIVEKIYRGSPEAIELLQQSGITHILVGPNEIGLKDFIINQSFFDDHFKVIADQKPFKLYSFIDSDYSNSPKLCPIPKRV